MLFDPTQGRWRIALLLGLAHGFGFAAILRATQPPSQHVATSLGAFILGLVMAQLGVVALAYPAILIVALWKSIARAFIA